MDLPVANFDAPGTFAFANPVRIHDFLKTNEFRNISIYEMGFNIIDVEDGHSYWSVLSDLAAPIIQLIDTLDENRRAEYIHDLMTAS